MRQILAQCFSWDQDNITIDIKITLLLEMQVKPTKQNLPTGFSGLWATSLMLDLNTHIILSTGVHALNIYSTSLLFPLFLVSPSDLSWVVWERRQRTSIKKSQCDSEKNSHQPTSQSKQLRYKKGTRIPKFTYGMGDRTLPNCFNPISKHFQREAKLA